MHNNNALYIVATPIGNLEDMTFRAVQVLKKVDIIAAEDTRHSAKLLQHFGVETPVVAYHDHSQEQQTARLLDRLQQGESVALISDAGTPLISDPGYRLVSSARQQGVSVIPIPGSCAVIAALSASGMPSDRFCFEGFLPAKANARITRLEALVNDERTLIFYESPHRIQEALRAMAEVFGSQRQVVLARELTKAFETFIAGDFSQLQAILAQDANQLRGEMVVLVQGKEKQDKVHESLDEKVTQMMAIMLAELPVKQAAGLVAKITGVKKNRLYQWALAQKDSP